ncbi:probable methyltransferase-like protein 24 [Ylistrum balloti]|uniref:probable methyltransferase-like protein 24 n=1 Tax=Ylistrum balloti TaxID=509963 RepID=UPI002905910E|nr:probable methyltransferase-like protein 24 [Ylistrum balloti]
MKSSQGKGCTMYFIAENLAEKHEFEAAFRCSLKIIDYSSFMTKIGKNNSTGSIMMELSAEGRVSVMMTTHNKQLEFFANLARRGILRKVEQLYINLDVTSENTTSQEYMIYLQQLKDIHSCGLKIYHFKRIRQLTYVSNRWITGRYVLYFIRETMDALPARLLPPTTILTNVTAVEGAALYHDYMLQSQFLCHDLVRVGQIGNGGWEICNDTDVRPAKECFVYSFGMNGNWAFEIDMIKKFGCTVHSFDQDKDLPSYANTSLIRRHLIGLWHEETFLYKNGGEKFRMETVKLIRARMGHDKVLIDIIKIDIGAAEWHILPNLIETGSLMAVRQLLIEVHVALQGADIHFREKLVILRQLYDMGFRLFWTHPSDEPSKTFRCSVNKKHTTCCYELHFVNKNHIR